MQQLAQRPSSHVHSKVSLVLLLVYIDFEEILPSFVTHFYTTGFQEDLEKGKVKHLFPTMFAKEQIKRGQMKEEEIPVRDKFSAIDDVYYVILIPLILQLYHVSFVGSTCNV